MKTLWICLFFTSCAVNSENCGHYEIRIDKNGAHIDTLSKVIKLSNGRKKVIGYLNSKAQSLHFYDPCGNISKAIKYSIDDSAKSEFRYHYKSECSISSYFHILNGDTFAYAHKEKSANGDTIKTLIYDFKSDTLKQIGLNVSGSDSSNIKLQFLNLIKVPVSYYHTITDDHGRDVFEYSIENNGQENKTTLTYRNKTLIKSYHRIGYPNYSTHTSASILYEYFQCE